MYWLLSSLLPPLKPLQHLLAPILPLTSGPHLGSPWYCQHHGSCLWAAHPKPCLPPSSPTSFLLHDPSQGASATFMDLCHDLLKPKGTWKAGIGYFLKPPLLIHATPPLPLCWGNSLQTQDNARWSSTRIPSGKQNTSLPAVQFPNLTGPRNYVLLCPTHTRFCLWKVRGCRKQASTHVWTLSPQTFTITFFSMPAAHSSTLIPERPFLSTLLFSPSYDSVDCSTTVCSHSLGSHSLGSRSWFFLRVTFGT